MGSIPIFICFIPYLLYYILMSRTFGAICPFLANFVNERLSFFVAIRCVYNIEKRLVVFDKKGQGGHAEVLSYSLA